MPGRARSSGDMHEYEGAALFADSARLRNAGRSRGDETAKPTGVCSGQGRGPDSRLRPCWTVGPGCLIQSAAQEHRADLQRQGMQDPDRTASVEDAALTARLSPCWTGGPSCLIRERGSGTRMTRDVTRCRQCMCRGRGPDCKVVTLLGRRAQIPGSRARFRNMVDTRCQELQAMRVSGARPRLQGSHLARPVAEVPGVQAATPARDAIQERGSRMCG